MLEMLKTWIQCQWKQTFSSGRSAAEVNCSQHKQKHPGGAQVHRLCGPKAESRLWPWTQRHRVGLDRVPGRFGLNETDQTERTDASDTWRTDGDETWLDCWRDILDFLFVFFPSKSSCVRLNQRTADEPGEGEKHKQNSNSSVKNNSDRLLHNFWRLFNFDLFFCILIIFPEVQSTLCTLSPLLLIPIYWRSDQWNSFLLPTTSCCCLNASGSFLLSVHLCSAVENKTEPNCLLPFQKSPWTATKEPPCVTCVEASVHLSPVLSKRLKKKGRKKGLKAKLKQWPFPMSHYGAEW